MLGLALACLATPGTAPARAAAATGSDALLGIGAGAPETTITFGPRDGETVGDRPPSFMFESSEPGSTFECRTYDPANPDGLDPSHAFKPCSSPHSTADLGPAIALGQQSVFEVRAIDSAGNVDPSPASRGYRKHGKLGEKPVVSKCDPVVIEATHGKGILSNCRIVRIRNGRVPCVHIESLKLTRCTFKPNSGRWIESTAGHDYALVGGAVSREGQPGGPYVIAAPIAKNRVSPCGKLPERTFATRSDTAGTPAGEELAGGCTVEVLGSATNATGLEMDNYATRELCTSTEPRAHNDAYDATLTRIPEPGVYCYIGEGAGLNDINGRERGPGNVYLPGSARCHVVWSSGAEMVAAKRPATTTYPAPGKVNPKTPLLWRPVASSVRIAN